MAVARDSGGVQEDVDDLDRRALTEYLTVLDDVGRARGAAELYLVVSRSGREYLADRAAYRVSIQQIDSICSGRSVLNISLWIRALSGSRQPNILVV